MSPVRKPRAKPPAPEVRVTIREVDDPARLERVLAILDRLLDTPVTPGENGPR